MSTNGLDAFEAAIKGVQAGCAELRRASFTMATAGPVKFAAIGKVKLMAMQEEAGAALRESASLRVRMEGVHHMAVCVGDYDAEHPILLDLRANAARLSRSAAEITAALQAVS